MPSKKTKKEEEDNILIRAAKALLLRKDNKAPAAQFAKGATARNKRLLEELRKARGGR